MHQENTSNANIPLKKPTFPKPNIPVKDKHGKSVNTWHSNLEVIGKKLILLLQSEG